MIIDELRLTIAEFRNPEAQIETTGALMFGEHPFCKLRCCIQSGLRCHEVYGPEIAFGHQMAMAWPDETIGIIRLAVGGTSILTWKPSWSKSWSKEDANRAGQGRVGSLYKRLMTKVEQAQLKTTDVSNGTIER